MIDQLDGQQELELFSIQTGSETEDNKEVKHSKEREAILQKVNSLRLDNLSSKTAWILNHFPETRDSDIELQLKFWENFESDFYNGSSISQESYKKLTRLTSIARARAKIQNEYKLFQASDVVKKYRGKLELDKREKALAENNYSKGFSVYADESGKNQDHLIVGSVWFIDGHDTFALMNKILSWREQNSFKDELHFTEINKRNLAYYKAIIDLFLSNSSLVSFKAISVKRAGLSSQKAETFVKLFYHLLKRGIEHEHESGRAPLPRGINLCKDAEEEGYDQVLIGEVSDRLQNASKSSFDDQLYLETFRADASKENNFLQIADLFTGSINRILNHKGNDSVSNAKDEFARYFLDRLGVEDKLPTEEQFNDMSVLLKI